MVGIFGSITYDNAHSDNHSGSLHRPVPHAHEAAYCTNRENGTEYGGCQHGAAIQGAGAICQHDTQAAHGYSVGS